MKKVICDHAGGCDSELCRHKQAHTEKRNCTHTTTCYLITETVRCVEAPDE